MKHLKHSQCCTKQQLKGKEKILSLSFGQHELWLEQQLYPNDTSLHFHFTAKLPEQMDIKLLKESITFLVKHHESLHTIFPTIKGTPIRKQLHINALHIKECSLLSEEQIKQKMQKLFEKPFNLTKEPPYRFYLYIKNKEYYFQIVSHHIANTLKSYINLPVMLAKTYLAKKNGTDLQCFIKSLTYSDYINTHYDRSKNITSKKFWSKYLSKELPLPLSLHDKQHYKTSKNSRKTYHNNLDKDIVSKLKEINKKQQSSFFSTMTAVFQILLNKYTKQKDLIIGIPIDETLDQQSPKSLNDIIGYTINTIPLRNNVNTSTSFINFIKMNNINFQSIKKYRSFPLSKIKENLTYHKDSIISDIFNVLITSHKAQNYKELILFGLGRNNINIDIDGFKYQSIGLGYIPTGRYDLTLSIIEIDQEYSISFNYNSHLISDQFICKLSENLTKLLKEIVSNPKESIQNFSIISTEDQNSQLNLLNKTSFKLKEQDSFLNSFEKTVHANSNSIALIFNNKKISYGELNTKANQLAHYLRKLGVQEETLIAFSIKRSPEMITTILGIMKAGAAFLPIAPDLPIERLKFMLKNSKANLLITQYSLKERIHNNKLKTILLDKDWHLINREKTTNLHLDFTLNQLAYVIYTSGSTGKPKGVEITQRALTNFLLAMNQNFQLSTNDSLLALTTISFDISNMEILLPLSQGAKIIIADEKTRKNPFLIEKSITNNSITICQATPATWQMLIDYGWKGHKNLTILCGGDTLPKKLANQLVEKSKILWNMYGPTETTIWSSMKKITHNKNKNSIGKPIHNTTFYVLDENQQLLPLGTPGELYIGGYGLARGYRNNKQLTKESFIISPFSNSISKKLYKTGDLVRYLPNGEVEHLGRLDNQIKFHGYRIELEEIEELIKKYTKLQQVIVTIKENTHLVAYFIGTCNLETLKKKLRKHLPHYMIPTAFISLEKFPLTSNNKIDKKALPIPSHFQNRSYNRPRNIKENNIALIFQNILRMKRIGIHANFFALGGNSLLATQAIILINKKFNINLPLKTLFYSPSIALLAKEIDQFTEKNNCYYKTIKAPKRKIFDSSSVQQRFWFLEQQIPNTPLHNIPFVIKIKGILDVDLLHKSLTTIVNRHDTLQTIFLEDSKTTLKQKIIKAQHNEIQLKYQDLQNSDTPEKTANQIITSESKKAFNLKLSPFFRFQLIKLKDKAHYLFCNFHHLIFDAHSINIFLNELKTLYSNYKTTQTMGLKTLKIQYIDYVYWNKKQKEDISENKQVSWWLDKLTGAPTTLELSTDKPRPKIQRFKGRTYQFLIADRSLITKLKKIARTEESTLFMLLLAIFHVFLYRYTGQKDMIIGVPVSNRNYSFFDSLIGCFVNTTPFRMTSQSEMSFFELLRWIKKESLEILKYQNLPFEKLIEKLKIDRSLSYSPLFQVMFNFLPKITIDKIHDLQIHINNLDRRMSNFDLTLSAQEVSEKLIGILEYNTDLFYHKTIKRMAKHFRNLIKSIVDNPYTKIKDLSLLSNYERKKQTISWNEQPIKYSTNRTIIQRIEEWAKKTPHAIAIIHGNSQYSYQEINTFANKIAHTLLGLGIKPNNKVIVYLERSAEFIPSILGILKATGTYVPIEPSEPYERKNEIFNNLQPAYILTDSSIKSPFLEKKNNIIYIDKLTTPLSNNPCISISDELLTYIIYTSGSTGKPKGVPINHKSINDRVSWKESAYPLTTQDVALHTYSFIFDGSIINYFWPLCSGTTLIIATKDELIDSAAMVSLITKFNITTIDLLPSLLQRLLEEDISSCSSLKYVFSGGEALPKEIIQIFYKQCSAKLYNTYGPTETTVEASVWESNANYKGPIAPIGKTIAGAQLYILDKDKNILPIGVSGELHIGGIGVSKGYLNDPLLTSKKFIKNPFNASSEDLLYCTGDRVKYLDDGNIEFLGRIDNQIKIRGFRIEPKEIEVAILSMNSINQVAIQVQGEGIHKYLVAYLVPNHQIAPHKLHQSMKQFLKDILPNHMIPQKLVILKKFPTLLNGKINYKGLPKPSSPKLKNSRENKNQLENELWHIWKEVLNCQSLISINDNFFEIGGNSLLVMRLLSEIKNRFNISIPLITFFQNPTILELGKILRQNNPKKQNSLIIPMHSKGHKTPFFCIHPIGGNILCYHPLAQSWIDKERPFYAIQAKGLEEGEKPLDSIEKMASEYISAMRKKQPTGPYIIGGWSFGGLIAIEIANQLQKEGEQIELLILIDTSANIKKFKKFNIDNESLLLSELTNHFISKPSPRQNKLSFKDKFINFIENGGKKQHTKNQYIVDRLIDLAKTHYKSLQKFSIPCLKNINTILIRTKENREKIKHLGWKKYLSSLSLFEAPGDHWAITQNKYAPYYSKILHKSIENNKIKSKI